MEPTYQSDDGQVKLYLADCLEVLPTLAAGSVDFVFTDPPYGHKNNDSEDLISVRERALGTGEYKAENNRPIQNDGKEANELFKAALLEYKRLLSPGCCCCCCGGGGGPDPQFARWSLWMDEVFDFKQMVVWDKGPMGMGWHYRRSYETVLVGTKPGAPVRWFDETNRVENIIRPGMKGIRKIIPSADQHPTEKPWQLAAHFIGLHSLPGHVVLDPFAGHGTTGVAAVRLGRRFVGVEIDPHYYEICERRIRKAKQQMLLGI